MQRRRVAIATQSGQMIFLTAIDRMIPYVRKRCLVRQTLSIADAVERGKSVAAGDGRCGDSHQERDIKHSSTRATTAAAGAGF